MSNSTFAQASFEGQVLDKTHEEPIPFATVTLAKARTATRTTDQGYFNLVATTAVDNDSLIITCVGYQSYKMPVTSYKKRTFILIQPSATQLKEVSIISAKRKIKTLGAFTVNDLDEIKWTGSVFYPQELFRAQMYAKLFKSPKKDAVVRSIDIGRLNASADYRSDLGEMQSNTKFMVHVMTADPATGAPDSILFTKQVWLQDRSRKVTIRLDSEGVVLPAERFFVAVEWLRIPYNEYIHRIEFITTVGKLNTQVNGGFDRVIYHPLLARYTWSPKAKSWQMTDGVWSIFDHPRFEMALSTTISY